MFMSGILGKRTRESSVLLSVELLEERYWKQMSDSITLKYLLLRVRIRVRNVLNYKFSPKILLIINTRRAR